MNIQHTTYNIFMMYFQKFLKINVPQKLKFSVIIKKNHAYFFKKKKQTKINIKVFVE